jgi:hypothetical protein
MKITIYMNNIYMLIYISSLGAGLFALSGGGLGDLGGLLLLFVLLLLGLLGLWPLSLGFLPGGGPAPADDGWALTVTDIPSPEKW